MVVGFGLAASGQVMAGVVMGSARAATGQASPTIASAAPANQARDFETVIFCIPSKTMAP